MTQPTPDRTVAGPPPRRPIDASRLVRGNRDRPAAPGEPGETGHSTAPPTPLAAPKARASKASRRSPSSRTVPVTVDEPKETVTVAIRASVRQRSRAAFREANYRERTRSYADFVEGAIEREIARIEAAYNDGRPLPADDNPLTPGRPAGP